MASTLITNIHLNPYERLSPKLLKGQFDGKSVLVTGGGYGIGKEIARSFAEAGVRSIILAGRTESHLKATADELVRDFPAVKVSYRIVDLEAHETIPALFNSLTESPDVLVNNAGFLSKPDSIVDADMTDWWRSFTVNVFGTALVTQHYLRHRKAAGAAAAGVVIFINTIAAFDVRVPRLSAYSASKAAAARMSELFAVDVPEDVARFISIHPGAVQTAMYTKSELDMPATDVKLTADFVAWSATERASFLASRFAWVNWDVDELLSKKDEILEKDLLRTNLKVM